MNSNATLNPAGLAKVILNPFYQALSDGAAGSCLGSVVWRSRKQAEAHNLCALSQVSRRFAITGLDLAVELRAELVMQVPVPCRPGPFGLVVVKPMARLAVFFREEAMWQAQPGASFVRILSPARVFHPDVNPDAVQALCLGRVRAATPCTEIVILSYFGLSLQLVQMDPEDAAGLLNRDAAEYWQASPEKIPLSREPFIEPGASL